VKKIPSDHVLRYPGGKTDRLSVIAPMIGAHRGQ
jgi:hypothetical protein